MRSSTQWIASSPPVPRIAAPSIRCVSPSTTSFIRPAVSPFSMARATSSIAILPTRTEWPAARPRSGHPGATERGIGVQRIGGDPVVHCSGFAVQQIGGDDLEVVTCSSKKNIHRLSASLRLNRANSIVPVCLRNVMGRRRRKRPWHRPWRDRRIHRADGQSSTSSPVPLRDRPAVQNHVAEAEAILGAARSFVLDAVGIACNGAGGADPSSRSQGPGWPSPTGCTRQFARSISCSMLAGTNAIYSSNPLERHFRDVHVVVQHNAAFRELRVGRKGASGPASE